jgi:hypothetical protein
MRASAGLSGSKHQPTSEGFTIQLKLTTVQLQHLGQVQPAPV